MASGGCVVGPFPPPHKDTITHAHAYLQALTCSTTHLVDRYSRSASRSHDASSAAASRISTSVAWRGGAGVKA